MTEDFEIRNMLSAGFGVEDISLRLKLHEDFVRFTIRRLRERGELAELYRSKASTIEVVGE